MQTTTTPATMTAPAAEPLRLERETCSRCGGSGQYSYCQMYGHTCFRCHGKGQTLTKRGAAAAAYLKTLRQRAASAVQVGDTIKMMGGITFNVWVKVEKVGPYVQEGASLRDGVMVPYRTEMKLFEGTCRGVAYSSAVGLDRPVELLLSKEEQLATLRQAIAYQETLTKAGTPRKRPAK